MERSNLLMEKLLIIKITVLIFITMNLETFSLTFMCASGMKWSLFPHFFQLVIILKFFRRNYLNLF